MLLTNIASGTIILCNALVTASSTGTHSKAEGIPVSNACLSSRQLNSVVHLINSMKNDWISLARENKAASHTDRLEDANEILDDIDVKMKLLKSEDNSSACVTNADYQELSDSSSGLLGVLNENLDQFYSLVNAKSVSKSSIIEKGTKQTPNYADHIHARDIHYGHETSGALSLEANARARGRGRYQPAYPPAYIPEYVPGYAPIPEGYEPLYPPVYRSAPGGYQPAVPAQYPQPTPNTGGYTYQGGNQEDIELPKVRRYMQEYEGVPYQNVPYQYPPYEYGPKYEPYNYGNPGQETGSETQPQLSDDSGDIFLRFAERLTETVLLQLEVIGFEFGRSEKKSSRSSTLLSETKEKALSYASKLLSHI